MLNLLLSGLLATQELFLWPQESSSVCDILSRLQESHSSKFRHNCKKDMSINSKKQLSPHKFIVTLHPNVSAHKMVSNITSVSNLESPGIVSIEEEYTFCINGFAALLSPQSLIDLLRNDNVVSVEQDNYAYLLSLQRNPIWNLDRIDQSDNRLDDLYNTGGLDGRGTDIYILDTGTSRIRMVRSIDNYYTTLTL